MTWWRRPYVWAIASAVAVVIANVGGLAVGDDGIGYEATADNLLAGHGLGYFLERHLTIWPPGWPLLMAFVSRVTPLSTAQAAIALNALTAFAIVLLTSRLLRRLVRDEQLAFLGTAVAAVGASSMVFGHLLMTDFAFAAITLALFLSLMNYRRTDEFAWMVISVLLVWAGFMIRYAGIVHIGTIGLWFLTDRRKTLFQRVRIAFVFGVGAAIVPALWIIRNIHTDDTALGVRYSSARGLLGNAFDTFATIGNFLTPGVAIEMRVIWAAVAVAGCAVMAVLLWRVLGSDPRVRTATGWVDIVASETGLLVLHIGVYLAYMLYARTTTGLNRLDFRLLNPVYLPLVIVALVILDRAGAPIGIGVARAWAGLNLLLGVGMIAYFATSPDLFVGNYERPAFDAVRHSSALAAITPGCKVSSNLPNALYEAGVEADWSPRNTGLESNDPVDDLDQLAADVDRHDHCLVWIDLEPRYGHLATLQELRARFDLVELDAADRVTVYRIERK
ncbi:MAG: hypothetical protein U0Q22_08505 [Acidimicrobiales bacterium]